MPVLDDYRPFHDFATGVNVGAGVMAANVRDRLNVLRLAAEGDMSKALIHQHGNGPLDDLLGASPKVPAGEAGRTFYATDQFTTYIDDGSRWSVLSIDPTKAVRMFDDFELRGDGPVASVTGSPTAWWGHGWELSSNGTGGQAIRSNTGTVVELQSRSVAGGYVRLLTANLGITPIPVAIQPNGMFPMSLRLLVRLMETTSVDYTFAVADDLTIARPATFNYGVGIRVQDGGNYVGLAKAKGGSFQTVDLGVTPSTTAFDRLRMEVSASAQVQTFYVNDVLRGTLNEDLHDHLNNLFTFSAGQVRPNSTSQRRLRIDQTDLVFVRGNRFGAAIT